MPLDINKYRHFLNDTDVSEQRKSEFIQDVWTILESFVDQAFGLHPVQQCHEHKKNTDLQGVPESLESNVSNTFIGFEDTVSTRLENRNES